MTPTVKLAKSTPQRRKIRKSRHAGFDETFGNANAYEQLLTADPRRAMSEGDLFFEGKSAVHQALKKIALRLNELGIPYSVVGGLALSKHGYRRLTDDVDLLVTQDGLRKIHEQLDGLGYLPPFTRSKNLRDTELGVRIEFLVEGQFPGDGKPKPVAFPNPDGVSFDADGVRYLKLPKLIELKLASGMTDRGRLKDLSDVLELIKLLGLPKEFRDGLNPFVRRKFTELWRRAQTRYVRLWRNKFLTLEAKNIDEMISILRASVAELEAMRADGVTLDPDGGTADDYANLVTTDPAVAKKYDMHNESEFLDDDEEDDEDEDETADSAGETTETDFEAEPPSPPE